MRVVVMSSGGLDSSLLLLMLAMEGHDLFPLHIDYGHLAEQREWAACQAICKHLHMREPVKLDVSGIRIIPSGLTNSSLHIEKNAFLPTRNLIFATLGAAYCYSISARVVAMGLLANPIFPDQTPEFVKAAEACISTALGTSIKIMTPFISLDKRETLKLAQKYKLPLEITYYCHSGNEEPCGVCVSCKERIAAEQPLNTHTQ